MSQDVFPMPYTTYFIATTPDGGWKRSEGLLLLHSFISLDILVAFSIVRFGTSAESLYHCACTNISAADPPLEGAVRLCTF